MPMFSQSSFSKLSTCHPDLQAIFFEVIKHFECSIVDSVLICDTSPCMKVLAIPHSKTWVQRSIYYYFAGLVCGIAFKLRDEGKITHGIKWDGDYDERRDSAFDLAHFELVP